MHGDYYPGDRDMPRSTPSAGQTDVVQQIEEICTRFMQNNLHRDYVGNPSNKLIIGLDIPVDEKVFLAWDDTFTKNGTVGFAITEKGLYARNRFESSSRFIPYSALPNGPVYSDKRDVYIGENHVAVYMGVYRGGLPKLVSLYTEIVNVLHE